MLCIKRKILRLTLILVAFCFLSFLILTRFDILPLHGGNFSSPPNILLISIDTLRADHLDAYGYERKTSPMITTLASRGILFKRAIAQASWTLPSMASLHTSLYPSEHKALGANTKISDDIKTAAEALQNAGYHTIGIVSHDFVDKQHGFSQGFQVFDESQILGHDGVTSEALTNLAIKYLEEAKQKSAPFFLWVHYFDPHFSYVRHSEFDFANENPENFPGMIRAEYLKERLKQQGQFSDKELEFVEAVYDEEIAYTDRWIGTLLDRLKRLKLNKSTVIVLTADHGEYFLERGRFFHSIDVYNELVHVPLIVSGAIEKTLRGAVVERPVELISIPRTIMGLAGIEERHFYGENLIELAKSQKDKKETTAPIFTEGNYAWGEDQRKKAVFFKNLKLIYNFDDASYELYDMDVDWNEQRNLWDEANSPEVNELKAFMKDELALFPPEREALSSSTIELSEETLDQLESLGYVR